MSSTTNHHGSFSHLFDKQAAEYAKFRPTYPPVLFTTILDFNPAAGRGMAVDIATGTGQAALGMAPHVDRVVALDANAQQLGAVDSSLVPDNITFAHGLAESTGLEDACADIVTCAQALHWYGMCMLKKSCMCLWYVMPMDHLCQDLSHAKLLS